MIVKLSDNLYKIRGRNPFSQVFRTLNIYVIPRMKLMIDTGSIINIHEIKKGLSKLNLSVSDIEMVIVTHAHLDHIGGVDYFINADVYLHPYEIDYILNFKRIQEDVVRKVRNYLRFANVSDEVIESIIKRYLNIVLNMTPKRRDYISIEGITTRDLKVIDTPGHTLGSISIIFGRWIFIGDSVSVSKGLYIQSVNDYMYTLNYLLTLIKPEVTLLPGHLEKVTYSAILRMKNYCLRRIKEIKRVLETNNVDLFKRRIREEFKLRLKDPISAVTYIRQLNNYLEYLSRENIELPEEISKLL